MGEEGAVADMGSLERAVMDVLWAADEPLTVRVVAASLEASAQRARAYTTVQTVADRLVAKGLLERTAAGRAWAYAPTVAHAEHVAETVADMLAAVPDRPAVLTRLVAHLGRRDRRILRDALTPRTRS